RGGDRAARPRRGSIHRRRLALHAVSQVVRLETSDRHARAPRRARRHARKRRPRAGLHRRRAPRRRHRPRARGRVGLRPRLWLSQQPGTRRHAALGRDGFPMILDPNKIFPRRPGKITVATRQTIEKRGDELTAYFRAIIRSFWFMRDVKNFDYVKDLETRLRKTNTHNEDERRLCIVTGPDRLDSWALPVDGGVAPEAIERIAAEMHSSGKLPRRLSADEILREGPVTSAYREVSARPALQPALKTALAAVEKYGF